MSLPLLQAFLSRKAAEKKMRNTKNIEVMGLHPKVNNICRVCGSHGDIDIFSSYHKRNLAEDIRLCSGIQVNINDGFPSYLCDECHTLLRYAVKFREMCRRSTEKLLKIKLGQTVDNLPTRKKVEYETGDCYDEWNYEPLSPEADDVQQDIANVSTWDRCQQEFSDVSSHKQHLRQCKRSLRQNKQQKGRKTRATDTKEYLCETCGKALATACSLINHRTIHQNIFPFKCNLCQYKGKTSSLLQTHRKMHLSEKPYRCTTCPQAFKTSSNLSKHVRIHKGRTEVFQCTLCDKKFLGEKTLRGHVGSVHGHRPALSCNLCNKQMYGRRALYSHRYKVHNWRAESKGRQPSYRLCQLDEPSPAMHAGTQQKPLTEQ